MSSTMTRRERLRRCYNMEELDRPAVYSRMWISDSDHTYDALRECMAQRAERKLWFFPRKYMDADTSQEFTEPVSDSWQRLVQILHTPAGDLRRSYMIGLQGQSGYCDEHYLKDRSDAEKFLSLPMPTFAGPAAEDFAKAQTSVGDSGIVEVVLGDNPAGSAASLFGSETFAMMTVTDRDIIHALCRRKMEVLQRTIRWLTGQGLGPYFDMEGEEYLVPPLHSPKDFQEFCVGYDKPVIDVIHETGGRIHVHCHGRVGSVFTGFLEMGADVVHPFEPPPMGDSTARQAKAVARGRLCLEGNIQIADFYEKTPDQIRRQTQELIADAFDDRRGLIVCPSASPYMPNQGQACLAQYQAMVETVVEFEK
jgi:hypothetical protein